MTSSRDKQWYELPRPAAMKNLIEVRDELRAKNLLDTEEPKLAEQPGTATEEQKAGRTVDGSFNDLKCPMMGATGARFGRNVPLTEAFPDTANLLNPNPRDISNALFTRKKFQPATILNVLAAAWIQFQVHDWFVHAKGTADDAHDLPLADGDSWFERPMRVPKTPVDPPKVPGSNRPPAYVNKNSHWWDGSNVYGSTEGRAEDSAHRHRRQDQGAGRRAPVPRRDHRHRAHRQPRQPVGGAEPPPQPVRPRAQRHLRHVQAGARRLDRRAAVPAGAPRQRGADGEDSHPRVDAGDPAASAAGAGAQRQLGRRAAGPPEGVSRPGRQRSAQRHPGVADRPSHRALLAHRGVRVGLPDALADAGRLRDPLGQGLARCSARSSCRRCRGAPAGR